MPHVDARVERWLPIVGWPYEVRDLGRVRRAPGHRHRNCTRDGVLTPTPLRNGYLTVKLYSGGMKRTVTVHPLVVTAFLGPRPTPDHQVAHFDGVRSNNALANLRWATRQENEADMVRHGNRRRGEAVNTAKLTPEKVRAIRGSTERTSLLVQRYLVSRQTIKRIRRGEGWRGV